VIALKGAINLKPLYVENSLNLKCSIIAGLIRLDTNTATFLQKTSTVYMDVP